MQAQRQPRRLDRAGQLVQAQPVRAAASLNRIASSSARVAHVSYASKHPSPSLFPPVDQRSCIVFPPSIVTYPRHLRFNRIFYAHFASVEPTSSGTAPSADTYTYPQSPSIGLNAI